jgi:hypothetical protein
MYKRREEVRGEIISVKEKKNLGNESELYVFFVFFVFEKEKNDKSF